MRLLVLPAIVLALASLAPATLAAAGPDMATEPVIVCVAAPCPGPADLDTLLDAADSAARDAAAARDAGLAAGADAERAAAQAAEDLLALCPDAACRPEAMPSPATQRAVEAIAAPAAEAADWLAVTFTPTVEEQASSFASVAVSEAREVSVLCLPRACSPAEAAAWVRDCVADAACPPALLATARAAAGGGCCFPGGGMLLQSTALVQALVGDALGLKDTGADAALATRDAALSAAGEGLASTCDGLDCDPAGRVGHAAATLQDTLQPMHCMAVECSPLWPVERLLWCRGDLTACVGFAADDAQRLLAGTEA